MTAAESSFGVFLSGERMLRTQTVPCGSDRSACSRSCVAEEQLHALAAALIELARARSCFERLRAPRAVMPKIRVDAPTAMRAARACCRGSFHGRLGLGTAPRTVAHERHQRPAALLVLALAHVALVREAPRRLDLEARARSTTGNSASRSSRRGGSADTRRDDGSRADRAAAPCRTTGSTASSSRHGPAQWRHRSASRSTCVLALELAEQHVLPQRRIVGLARARAPALLAGAVAQPLELAVHRRGVLEALLGPHLDRAAQPVDELRPSSFSRTRLISGGGQSYGHSGR